MLSVLQDPPKADDSQLLVDLFGSPFLSDLTDSGLRLTDLVTNRITMASGCS